jgi:hypothetical protein
MGQLKTVALKAAATRLTCGWQTKFRGRRNPINRSVRRQR